MKRYNAFTSYDNHVGLVSELLNLVGSLKIVSVILAGSAWNSKTRKIE